MPTYVTLYQYTEQGIRNIKESPKRVQTVSKAMGDKFGVAVKTALWIQGKYDFLTITEAPDEASAASAAIEIAKMGNVRTLTMRAFTAAEWEKILEKVA